MKPIESELKTMMMLLFGALWIYGCGESLCRFGHLVIDYEGVIF